MANKVTINIYGGNNQVIPEVKCWIPCPKIEED